ncbi:MAG: SIS domain-containing protein, partial [Alphaproteobacteria bacterium]|nr:SIS domain-containing protein [Alphaproteobacteria bacterium]
PCARYGADLFGNIASIEARAIYSSEFLLKAAVPHETTILYVFITQSGETSDTNEALNRAKELGMRTMAITNKIGSTIWRAADFKIDCHAGEEKSIAATKSLITQMVCVTLLVLKFAQLKGTDISEYLGQIKFIPEVISRVLVMHKDISKVAKKLSKYKLIAVTADGISYAIAKEISLKIKETSYICTISSILGEFMHGHVAVLNNKSAQIHVSAEPLHEIAVRNLNKMREDYNIPLCYIGDLQEPIKTDYILNIDVKDFIPRAFGTVVIGQLLALEIAKSLKRNVDKPHGLNKVVK